MSAYVKALTLGLIAATGLVVSGCAETPNRGEPTFEMAAQNGFIPSNRAAAAAMLTQIKGRLVPNQGVIMATVVDINKLEKSSALGRMVAEQISAVFTDAGFPMIEMKFRGNVYIRQNEGEFMLTREITEVARQQKAQAVVVGTYAVASDMVLVNLKVIQPNTNTVMAAHDYALPLDRNVRALLSSQ